MTQQDTQPPAETLADRETVARIVNPNAFTWRQSLYDYCISQGDTGDEAQRIADDTHKPDCDKAFAKADAILAALTRRAGGDAIPAGESLALRAIKAVTATGKDGPQALSRIMAITISAGVKQQYFELLTDPDVALIVDRPRTEWAHLFKPGATGCAIPPDGWECSRERGHDGPCAATPRPSAGGDAGAVEDSINAVLERWDAHSGDVDERKRLIARLRASFSAEGK